MPNRREPALVERPRDIRDLLGFRLSLLTTISDRKAQSQISGKFGMSLGEWRVLGAIQAYAPVTLAGLARELYQDKGQLSRTIKALSGRGLVASAHDARDKRNLFFRLTPTGKRWHDRMLAFAADRNAHLVDGLKAKERAELFRLLAKLATATAAAYAETLAAQGERKTARAADRATIARLEARQ